MYMALAMSAVSSLLGKGEQGSQKVQAFMTLVSIESVKSSPTSSATAQFQAFCAEAVDCASAAYVGSALEMTSSDESEIRFADASDDKEDSTIPGSDFPTAQALTQPSSSRSELQLDNGSRVWLGVFVVIISVLGLMTGLTIEGCEPFPAISGWLSTMVLGAVPLVYTRGRNAAISTLICSADMLVLFIFV